MKRSFQSKIYHLPDLKKKLQQLKGAKVVFTNGCFDLLHEGHITYLEKASFLGSFLIVAVNADDYLRRMKGPLRPVYTLESRLRILAALESVDAVIPFYDHTPLEIILDLKPNVIVKGADYQIKDIVGAKEIISWGGEVKTIPFVPHFSSSEVIKKIYSQNV